MKTYTKKVHIYKLFICSFFVFFSSNLHAQDIPIPDIDLSFLNNVLPPFNLSGNTSYDFSTSKTNEKDSTSTHVAILSVNAASYIWQPWFATFSSSISGQQSSTSTGGTGTTMTNVFGNFASRILPQSSFPTLFTYARSNNSTESDESQSENVTNTFGLQNNFIWDETLNITSSLRHNNGTSEDSYSEQNSLGLSGNLTLDTQVIGLQFGYLNSLSESKASSSSTSGTATTTTTNSETVTDTVNGGLNYTYMPWDNVTYSSNLGATLSEGQEAQLNSETFSFQSSSSLMWTPEEEPYSVSAVWTTNMTSTESDYTAGSSNQDSSTSVTETSGQLSANYFISDYSSLTAALNGSITQKEDSTDSTTTSNNVTDTQQDTDDGALIYGGSLSYGYNSLREEIYGFDWNWGGNAMGSFQSNAVELTHNQSATFLQTISKDYELPLIGSIKMSGNESLISALTSAGEGALTVGLSHGLNFSQSYAEGSKYSLINLGLTDNRDIVATQKNSRQSLNFQVSKTLDTSAHSHWSVGGNFQLSRTFTGKSSSSSGSSDSSSSGSPVVWAKSSSGSINYKRERLFGVRFLDSVTSFSMSSNGFLPFSTKTATAGTTTNASDSEEELKTWTRNLGVNLTYRLGLINVTSAYAMTQNEQKDLTQSIRLSISRPF